MHFFKTRITKKNSQKRYFPPTGNCEEGPFVYQLDIDGYPTEGMPGDRLLLWTTVSFSFFDFVNQDSGSSKINIAKGTTDPGVDCFEQ